MRGIALGVLAGAALSSGAAAAQPSRVAAAAGTYRIAVCKAGPCATADTGRALLLGYLVLAAARVPPGALPPAARAALPDQFLPAAANGCFALTRGRASGRTHAGLALVAATYWRPDSDAAGAVRFLLYHSPDAGHEVRAVVRSGGMRGRGTSWGPGADEGRWSADTVVAVRAGPPDLRRCQSALAR
jgi:hypothetical protein